MLKLTDEFLKIDDSLLIKKAAPVNKFMSHNDQKKNTDPIWEQLSNQILLTPSMRRMMQKKDASVMLKEEVGESILRLKASKFG